MITERSVTRLMNFSDGVMAIAVTLLVLPLVNQVADLNQVTWQALQNILVNQMLFFVISFIVICRMWMVHHNMFQPLKQFDSVILWLNSFWLLTIVVLPFSTQLLGDSNTTSALGIGVYIGTLLATMIIGMLIDWRINRSPQLLKKDAKYDRSLVSGVVPVILMTAIFVIAVTWPNIGPWALFLLFLSDPLTRVLQKRRG